MERQRDARRKLHARDKAGSLDRHVGGARRKTVIVAPYGAGEGVESKIEGHALPGLLFDGTEPGLRGIAQDHAHLRVDIEEAAVVQRCEVKTKAAKIVREENAAANI